ncbi:hypothetical protein IMCC3317_03380 [Kordia antarctica]|uniref:DUF4142 domain-containing protein n=1 Tax=Kordia antarctica TaxID=1218801 RepID=A0A7L4ZDY4_9FLAO|nr:hypothetical protein [Kordia antarctica]QHI34992.1 hypothetical protein IMCC3317_03380 [Kordia antarctica]
MKSNTYIQKITGLAIVTFIVMNFNSCEYFVRSDKAETIRTAESNEAISIQKNEAKLLVMASKNNLDVIKLCTIIEDEKVDENVKNLVEEIKNEQLTILAKYNELASENVISIPRYSTLKYEEIMTLKDSEGLEDHLKLLSTKIYNQQNFLDKLSDTTDNSEFKEMAQFANNTLKKSLNKTEKTLEILNTNS